MYDETPYQPPRRSRATRSFAARSKSSVRGFLFAHLPAQDRPRQIIYESNLERRVLLTFLARRDLVDVWDQPPAISFSGPSGTLRHHTPDFLAFLENGLRLAIAVKPMASVDRLRFRDELSQVRSAMSPAYADELVLITDVDLNDAEVRNSSSTCERCGGADSSICRTCHFDSRARCGDGRLRTQASSFR